MFHAGCTRAETGSPGPPIEPGRADTAAVVFGPSLVEMFWIGGLQGRLAAVDRHTRWPLELADVPRAGDFMSPSLEAIAGMGATSIHVVGTNRSLEDLAARLEIPLYRYSFDRLSDMADACARLEGIYSEAFFDDFLLELTMLLDSLHAVHHGNPMDVMMVIHMAEDGYITVAGRETFFGDIIDAAGCTVAAPAAGTYPSVSVEGIISLGPDRVLILSPEGDYESLMNAWERRGLSRLNTHVLTGEHVLIPGARLPELIREVSRCLM